MAQHPPPPHLNPQRLKTSLKMAISKLKFIQEKKTALSKQQRRQLADLLNQGKETSAKIRVENIIRDDIYIELLEYLELYCELLLARISIILDPKRTEIDPSLKEAVSSIIYASPHTELKEISGIRDIFWFKYGNEFGKSVIDNENDEYVPSKIVKRCQVDPPPENLVDLYLCEIAKAYQAPYSGLDNLTESDEEQEDSTLKNSTPATKDDDEDDDDTPSGGQAVKNLEQPIEELTGQTAKEDKPNTSTKSKVKSPVQKEQNEFDALKARFAALKTGK